MPVPPKFGHFRNRQAIGIGSGNTTVSNCLFRGNTALAGGAVAIAATVPKAGPSLINCTFSGGPNDGSDCVNDRDCG